MNAMDILEYSPGGSFAPAHFSTGSDVFRLYPNLFNSTTPLFSSTCHHNPTGVGRNLSGYPHNLSSSDDRSDFSPYSLSGHRLQPFWFSSDRLTPSHGRRSQAGFTTVLGLSSQPFRFLGYNRLGIRIASLPQQESDPAGSSFFPLHISPFCESVKGICMMDLGSA